jgi:uncharacterized membrane protein YraQ (UPF0718 family)
MTVVYDLLVVLHLLGMAVVVGGYLTVVRSPRVLPGMLHGALLQLVSGLALVGLREGGAVHDDPLNHTKIGVKLVIALVVAGAALVGRRRHLERDGLAHAVGGLAIVNVLVAVLWT